MVPVSAGDVHGVRDLLGASGAVEKLPRDAEGVEYAVHVLTAVTVDGAARDSVVCRGSMSQEIILRTVEIKALREAAAGWQGGWNNKTRRGRIQRAKKAAAGWQLSPDA